ncbi:MAG TPA: protease, partial [Massilia sp.]|nr:protease [Massilia sp.]
MCGLLACVLASTALAAKPTERSRQKAAAEAKRARLPQKLSGGEKKKNTTPEQKKEESD